MATTVKEAIWWATLRHRPGPKPDIALFAAYRGGSTWLLEMISTEPGVRPVNEPFSPWWGTPAQVHLMPKYRYGEVISFDTDKAESDFRGYSDAVFSGKVTVNAPWWFWRRGYPFRSDRLCVKITEAKGLIDWFDRTYDLDIVMLLRHPLPVALSRMRNHWETTAAAYLIDAWFSQQVLGPDLLDYCRDVLRNGSLLDGHVLGWALEHLVGLRLLPERPDWTLVTYEECVVMPERTIDKLSSRLQLTNAAGMQARLRVPSRSSRLSMSGTTRQISAGHPETALSDWRQHVTTEQEASAMRILTRLGISLYEMGRDLPVCEPFTDA